MQKKPAKPRFDDQNDYEDPIDRVRLRRAEPRRKGEKKIVTNRPATSSYYLGMIALIPIVGTICGPIAVVLSVQGFAEYRRNPEGGGWGRAKSGLWFGLIASCLYTLFPLAFYLLILLRPFR